MEHESGSEEQKIFPLWLWWTGQGTFAWGLLKTLIGWWRWMMEVLRLWSVSRLLLATRTSRAVFWKSSCWFNIPVLRETMILARQKLTKIWGELRFAGRSCKSSCQPIHASGRQRWEQPLTPSKQATRWLLNFRKVFGCLKFLKRGHLFPHLVDYGFSTGPVQGWFARPLAPPSACSTESKPLRG